MNNLQSIEVQILNAFVENNQGGNPAGVVLDADDLTHDQKLAVAAQVGLSETAFVSKSQTADFKLDFFTPNRQIAHCGHATIATFSYLKQLGKIKEANTSKETVDGRREIKMVGDLAFMEQTAPNYTEISAAKKEEVLQSLALKESDLLPNAPILVVNTGNSFLLVPVKNTQILKGLQANSDLISKVSEEFDLIGYYVFTPTVKSAEKDVQTRMFAPRYGIEEEAGTGMAAGPLACYLYDVLHLKQEHFLIAQGQWMENPSPSLIVVDLTLEDSKIVGLMAGGEGKLSSVKVVNI
ncbi:MAG: PhzF family phenazine biosynthesis protein [Chitinophagales bacterium]